MSLPDFFRKVVVSAKDGTQVSYVSEVHKTHQSLGRVRLAYEVMRVQLLTWHS